MNANWAEVALTLNNGIVELQINDNGEGIINPEKINHYGLIIMRERANSLNGSYSKGSQRRWNAIICHISVNHYP